VPGIQDIAVETGLSTATVSRALRGLPSVAPATIALVRRAADRLGYVPSSAASGLATGRNRAIGVLVPVIDRWFFIRVIDGIDAELRAAGYDLLLYNLGGLGGDRQRLFHRSILRQRIDGLLVLALTFDEEERAQLQGTEYPAIAIGGPGPGLRHIGIDDLAASKLAMSHLIELGHRRIAHIGGDDVVGANSNVPVLRRRGYTESLHGIGVDVRPDWIDDGLFTVEGGYAAAHRLLRDPGDRPSAIFASSDEMAIGAVQAARDLGLGVPRDVSVIGIDGHHYGELMGVTTVAQDPAAQGAAAARALVAELAGGDPVPDFEPAAVELIVRATTAAPQPAAEPASVVRS
jgi:LacI family transcriptional regulator, repressor for deo operon, udp, cdd, tsx, nupC, and nupG